MSRLHHTKNKGDIGCLKAQVKMAELGYAILIPLTEHEYFDFVAYMDGVFRRIQAKYRTVCNGKITVPLRTTWADRNGSHVNHINKSEIDLIAIYCPDTDAIYFVDPKMFKNINSINLRVEHPKNNQSKGILFARDFLRVP